jgi:hypothetical protein
MPNTHHQWGKRKTITSLCDTNGAWGGFVYVAKVNGMPPLETLRYQCWSETNAQDQPPCAIEQWWMSLPLLNQDSSPPQIKSTIAAVGGGEGGSAAARVWRRGLPWLSDKGFCRMSWMTSTWTYKARNNYVIRKTTQNNCVIRTYKEIMLKGHGYRLGGESGAYTVGWLGEPWPTLNIWKTFILGYLGKFSSHMGSAKIQIREVCPTMQFCASITRVNKWFTTFMIMASTNAL